ncbi:MAG: hypothetical protein WA005_15980 [Candidatus Binataceae bacterium]
MARRPFASLAGLAIATLIVVAQRASAQNFPQHTLHSVAAIIAEKAAQKSTVGNAFFVEVPSKAFPGRSFVYLVTARHNLFDLQGRRYTKLWVALEDSATGANREDPLPDESHWILDPNRESADLAAIPLNPRNANIAPVPISATFAELSEARVGALPATVDVGADSYYLTAAELGDRKTRLVALAHFGRVSVAEAALATIPGAGSQALYFVDTAGSAEASGAPVFVRAEDRYLLWGMMEAEPEASGNDDSALDGLSGVLPASYIAETVEAMAAVQERKSKR